MAKVPKLPEQWLPIVLAPPHTDLEVRVKEGRNRCTLVFPVHRKGASWVDVRPKSLSISRPRIGASGLTAIKSKGLGLFVVGGKVFELPFFFSEKTLLHGPLNGISLAQN